MKLLVTGGAGFIGSNFIYYELDHSDDQILCLDKLTYAGNLETLAPIRENARFSFVRGDIADRTFVYALFEQENRIWWSILRRKVMWTAPLPIPVYFWKPIS